MTANETKALELLNIYTRGTFEPYYLSGRTNVHKRVDIMAVLTGAKVTQARAGVTAIRDTFYALSNAQGNCDAERSQNFRIWAKGMLCQVRMESYQNNLQQAGIDPQSI